MSYHYLNPRSACGFGLFDPTGISDNCGDVAAMQAMLKALGFDPGEIDGYMGTNTQRAANAYARSKGLPENKFRGPFCAALASDYAMLLAGTAVPGQQAAPAGQQPAPGTPAQAPTQPGWQLPPIPAIWPPPTQPQQPGPGAPTAAPPAAPTAAPPAGGAASAVQQAAQAAETIGGALARGAAAALTPQQAQQAAATIGGAVAQGAAALSPQQAQAAAQKMAEEAAKGLVKGAASAWWESIGGTKLLIGGLLLVAVAVVAVSALRGRGRARGRPTGGLERKEAAEVGTYTPNPRRRRRGRRAARRRVPRCHRTPPAKYRRLGATRPEHYAYPDCYLYPLYFTSPAQSVKHIRNAAARFAQNKHRYPPAVRKIIERNIDIAKRQFGIGEYRTALPRGVVRFEAARRRRRKRRAVRYAANCPACV